MCGCFNWPIVCVLYECVFLFPFFFIYAAADVVTDSSANRHTCTHTYVRMCMHFLCTVFSLMNISIIAFFSFLQRWEMVCFCEKELNEKVLMATIKKQNRNWCIFSIRLLKKICIFTFRKKKKIKKMVTTGLGRLLIIFILYPASVQKEAEESFSVRQQQFLLHVKCICIRKTV